MKRIWLPICLLVMVGCIAPEDPIEKVAEEIAKVETVPAEEKPIEPLADAKVNAQNTMVLAKRIQDIERSLNNINMGLMRLNFYNTELAKDSTLQGPYAVVEEAWKAHLEELKARQQENAMIRQQQQQIANLNQRLGALEKNGTPESPVPPVPPEEPPAEETDAEPEDSK